MPSQYYETDRAASEYLLFHYGFTHHPSPHVAVGSAALNFPERCVAECLDLQRLPNNSRALDLGCAVGRATFELARHCAHVIGIDYSKSFIRIARRLCQKGAVRFAYAEEGDITQDAEARVPADIDRKRVRFEQGDATDLRRNLGQFEVVLMANLIDRLNNPAKCLRQLPDLVKPDGQLIITSPYTWLTDYTPRKRWLGGFLRGRKSVRTLETLQETLDPDFELTRTLDLPFLIREHARKFQLSIAEASVWRRR